MCWIINQGHLLLKLDRGLVYNDYYLNYLNEHWKRNLQLIKHRAYGIYLLLKINIMPQIRGMAGKFVDTISIFNRKRNSVKMNISGFAKIFHEQIDEIL